MTNEEFEKRWNRHVEFILNQQAQHEAEWLKLKAAQAQTEQSIDRAAKNISYLAGFIHEGFGLTMNLISETDAKIRAHFEEELRKLTARMDRHLSEDHGLEN
jgi:endonuclease/exonuclease/phosphatase (EEP) superfamily protein YafD